MKHDLGVCLVVCFAIFGLGSAIKCYNCKEPSATCTISQDCISDDACLTLNGQGGVTYHQCVKLSSCTADKLSSLFPAAKKFEYNCCQRDLCNGANSIGASKPLLGLFASLAVMWWCLH